MPVDASIYSIGAERPKSMLEYQAEFEDRDTRRQSNNLLMQGQRQKLDEYWRAIRSQESMRNLLQSLAPDASDDDRANALYAEGTPEAIAMAEKLRKAADDSRRTKSSTLKDDVDSENKVVAAYRDMIGMVSDPQAAAQLVTVMHSDPRLKNTPMARVPLEQGLAQIGQDPQAFAQWKQQFGLGATKYIEQNKPQYITQNLGGTSQITALPGLGGPGTVASSSPVTVSPGDQLQAQTTRRGQDLINARAREQIAETQRSNQVKEGATEKPRALPSTALKLQTEELDALGTFKGLDADIGALEKQLKEGKLKPGLVNNAVGTARNAIGFSNEESRNLASFRAKLENMRNAVLLLNKGVQTEGDAQRAMDEIMSNINDPGVVAQRLAEVRALNRRAADLRKLNVQRIRQDSNAGELDFTPYENQPAALDLPKPGAPAKTKSGATASNW